MLNSIEINDSRKTGHAFAELAYIRVEWYDRVRTNNEVSRVSKNRR